MRVRLWIVLASLVASSGCATLFNGSTQRIFVRGGPSKGITKIQTPDGAVDIEGGTGSTFVSRAKGDLPITVVCPDGKRKSGVIRTQFDWVMGGAVNLLNGGIGWFVDPFMDKGYNVGDVQLGEFCPEKI